MKNQFCFAAYILCMASIFPVITYGQAPGDKSYISFKNGAGYFRLSGNGKGAALEVGNMEYPGVVRAVKSLQTDITAVTKTSPDLLTGNVGNANQIVVKPTALYIHQVV